MSLETAYLFQGMSEATRAKAAAAALTEARESGAFLFRAGDAAEQFYILLEGRVRLSMRGAGQIAHIVSEPGDMLGWSSMVGHASYIASAECVVPVKVLKFDRARLMRLLEEDPAGGMDFYRRLAQMIARRLVASYGHALSLHGERDMRHWG